MSDEVELARAAYGEVALCDGEKWIRLENCPLEPGWNLGSTPVLVEIPVGYPTTPPDNFYTAADLRLSDGQLPGNTMGVKTIDGVEWLGFSYHVDAGTWLAHADLNHSHTLVDYLAGVLARLREAT